MPGANAANSALRPRLGLAKGALWAHARAAAHRAVQQLFRGQLRAHAPPPHRVVRIDDDRAPARRHLDIINRVGHVLAPAIAVCSK